MSKLAELQGRWADWLNENVDGATFLPGAGKVEIDDYEQEVGIPFTEELREWFTLVGGSEETEGMPSYAGISIGESRREWQMWRQLEDMNDEIAEYCVSHPEEHILPAYTLRGWIPLFQAPSTSYYLGVDLNPGPQGRVGQVINFGRDDEL